MTSAPGVEIRIALLICYLQSYEIELGHYFCPEFVAHGTNQNILIGGHEDENNFQTLNVNYRNSERRNSLPKAKQSIFDHCPKNFLSFSKKSSQKIVDGLLTSV